MKILFITHETTRTGAPLVLLYFLKWLKKTHPENEIHVLSLDEGVLVEEFINNADRYYSLSNIRNKRPSLTEKVSRKLFRLFNFGKGKTRKDCLIESFSNESFDLIYANTVVSLPIGLKIKGITSSKLLLHVHELEGEIRGTIGSLKNLGKNINLTIAASEIVKENLINNHGFLIEQVNVIYEFTKEIKLKHPEKKDTDREERIFRIGGSGKVSLRKGTDIFIQVARYITSNFPEVNVEFIWVGLVPQNEKVQIISDLDKLNLKEKVKFTGEVEKPEVFFSDFDVFVLTSREDPFPLVCIEAGILGKPIICFEKATGIAERINDGGGFILPYLSIEAIAEKILFYIQHPEIAICHGRHNKEVFSELIVTNKGKDIYAAIRSISDKCI